MHHIRGTAAVQLGAGGRRKHGRGSAALNLSRQAVQESCTRKHADPQHHDASPRISQMPAPGLTDKRTIRLANGFEYPLLGLGTWGLYGATCQASVQSAFANSYGLLDTSSAYGNEEAIGITWSSGVPQGLIIQSKVGPRQMGYDKAREAIAASISQMGRLDVVLIHWPGKSRRQRIGTWRALEEVYDAGHVRAIGVSNFLPVHFEQLMEDGARHRPMVNQFELHPMCCNREVVEYCNANQIAVQSYCTIGGGPAKGSIRKEHGTSILLGHPVVQSIAAEVQRTAAVVCLRWAVQQGFAIIPKSRASLHIANNSEVWAFTLSPKQVERLNALEEDHHFAWDPRTTL